MGSDNPASAENQQERLIRLGWVIGFVDGEGCFSIGFVRQPDRPGRRGYSSGYQVFQHIAEFYNYLGQLIVTAAVYRGLALLLCHRSG